MGLFDSLKNALGSNEPEETDDSDDTSTDMFSVPESAVKDTVDVDYRTEIIEEHYDGVSQEQARQIAEILESYLESTDGYTTDEIQDDVSETVDLTDGLIERIVRTEIQSITWMKTISNYTDRRNADEIVVKLSGPDDDRAHTICTKTIEEIENRGGGVPIGELKTILTDKAEEYKQEGGTPERMDHWVPYELCRFAIVRHVA